jgi:hypothetical protein
MLISGRSCILRATGAGEPVFERHGGASTGVGRRKGLFVFRVGLFALAALRIFAMRAGTERRRIMGEGS